MRPIDADDLENVVLQLNKKGRAITRGEYKLVDNIIFEFPTIDVAPVKHGRWSGRLIGLGRTSITCSECGEWADVASNYCPNCGAKMEGEE